MKAGSSFCRRSEKECSKRTEGLCVKSVTSSISLVSCRTFVSFNVDDGEIEEAGQINRHDRAPR